MAAIFGFSRPPVVGPAVEPRVDLALNPWVDHGAHDAKSSAAAGHGGRARRWNDARCPRSGLGRLPGDALLRTAHGYVAADDVRSLRNPSASTPRSRLPAPAWYGSQL